MPLMSLSSGNPRPCGHRPVCEQPDTPCSLSSITSDREKPSGEAGKVAGTIILLLPGHDGSLVDQVQ